MFQRVFGGFGLRIGNMDKTGYAADEIGLIIINHAVAKTTRQSNSTSMIL